MISFSSFLFIGVVKISLKPKGWKIIDKNFITVYEYFLNQNSKIANEVAKKSKIAAIAAICKIWFFLKTKSLRKEQFSK